MQAGLRMALRNCGVGQLRRCRNDATNKRGPYRHVCPTRKTHDQARIIFFLISLVAAFFGFTGVAQGSRTIAKVLFFIALTIFLIVLVFGVLLGMLVF